MGCPQGHNLIVFVSLTMGVATTILFAAFVAAVTSQATFNFKASLFIFYRWKIGIGAGGYCYNESDGCITLQAAGDTIWHWWN